MLETFFFKARSEFETFKNKPEIYAKRVKAISDSFNLQKPLHLHSSEMPVYWGGNLLPGKDKIALVEINSEYDSQRTAFENQLGASSWNHYSDFRNNLFLYYKNKSSWSLDNYKTLANCLSRHSYKNRTHLEFLHENVVRLDILPYTSIDFHKSKFSSNAEDYLFNRFSFELLPFMIENPNIKKAIFHNKILTRVLQKHNFINEDDMIYVRMNKGKNLDFIYKKKYNDLDLFIFSRSIPFGGFMKSEVYSNVFG